MIRMNVGKTGAVEVGDAQEERRANRKTKYEIRNTQRILRVAYCALRVYECLWEYLVIDKYFESTGARCLNNLRRCVH